ncbi:DMT family transporter [Paenibacillus sp. GCM10027626]|uniref:DMT family transporter n=1 Tax=Paenibacillus sp. GCM10027626 TaxID=3273411 RepID=UPI003642F48C
MRNIVFLMLAIICEVSGSTMLKYAEGFTVLLPSIGVVVGFVTSFFFLGLALKGLALSTAYAVWSGLGTALTTCAGIVLFQEEVSAVKVTALFLIIAGVVILNKSQDNKDGAEEAAAG